MTTMDLLFAEVTGTLEERSPAELVALMDDKKVTGVLEAHDGPRRWEFILRGGEIVESESTEKSGDPPSTFLELKAGKYRLRPQLLLPDGSVSDRRVAEGDLSETAPGKLLRTCERGGLTGALRLLSEDRFAEVLFDAGTLTAITLDGHQDVDAADLLRWTSGRWAILARPALSAPPSPDDSGIVFLREVEMALADLIGARDDDTTAERSRPKKRRRDDSVRIVYLDTVEPLEDSASKPSRYAEKDLTAVQVFYGKTSRKEGEAKGPAEEATPAEEERDEPEGAPEDELEEAAPADEGSWSDEPEEAEEDGSEEDGSEEAEEEGSEEEEPSPEKPEPGSKPDAEKEGPSRWADSPWVWVLAGLALALLIGLLHLTSPGGAN